MEHPVVPTTSPVELTADKMELPADITTIPASSRKVKQTTSKSTTLTISTTGNLRIDSTTAAEVAVEVVDVVMEHSEATDTLGKKHISLQMTTSPLQTRKSSS